MPQPCPAVLRRAHRKHPMPYDQRTQLCVFLGVFCRPLSCTPMTTGTGYQTRPLSGFSVHPEACPFLFGKIGVSLSLTRFSTSTQRPRGAVGNRGPVPLMARRASGVLDRRRRSAPSRGTRARRLVGLTFVKPAMDGQCSICDVRNGLSIDLFGDKVAARERSAHGWPAARDVSRRCASRCFQCSLHDRPRTCLIWNIGRVGDRRCLCSV